MIFIEVKPSNECFNAEPAFSFLHRRPDLSSCIVAIMETTDLLQRYKKYSVLLIWLVVLWSRKGVLAYQLNCGKAVQRCRSVQVPGKIQAVYRACRLIVLPNAFFSHHPNADPEIYQPVLVQGIYKQHRNARRTSGFDSLLATSSGGVATHSLSTAKLRRADPLQARAPLLILTPDYAVPDTMTTAPDGRAKSGFSEGRGHGFAAPFVMTASHTLPSFKPFG